MKSREPSLRIGCRIVTAKGWSQWDVAGEGHGNDWNARVLARELTETRSAVGYQTQYGVNSSMDQPIGESYLVKGSSSATAATLALNT